MTSVVTPNNRTFLSFQDMKAFLYEYLRSSEDGTFNITLVKENGQGYQAVLHRGGRTKKTRIALKSRGVLASTWRVRDALEEVVGCFPESVLRKVDDTIQGLTGSVMVEVRQGCAVKASVHEGEIWP